MLLCAIGTTAIDGRTFHDYYCRGNVAALAEMIEAKQGSRLNRRNRPVAVRVLQHCSGDSNASRALDLDDIEMVLRDGQLAATGLPVIKRQTVRCRPYGGPVIDVPLGD
jgi:hypothetical protein